LSYVSAAVKETNFSLAGQVGADASIIFLPWLQGIRPARIHHDTPESGDD